VQTLALGSVATEPLSHHPELVAAPVAVLVERLGLGTAIGVFEIDPAISDTAATQARYDLDPASLVNCVIVAGRREGEERLAACLVPATKRADVNGVVRRRLDVARPRSSRRPTPSSGPAWSTAASRRSGCLTGGRYSWTRTS